MGVVSQDAGEESGDAVLKAVGKKLFNYLQVCLFFLLI